MKLAKLLLILTLLFVLPASLTLGGCRAEGEVDDDGVEMDMDT